MIDDRIKLLAKHIEQEHPPTIKIAVMIQQLMQEMRPSDFKWYSWRPEDRAIILELQRLRDFIDDAREITQEMRKVEGCELCAEMSRLFFTGVAKDNNACQTSI